MRLPAQTGSGIVCALTLSPLLSCSGGSAPSSSSIVSPSPVEAAAYVYSTVSLSGTYTITMSARDDAAIISPVSFVGNLVFDGNGNITSGAITGATTTYGTSASPGVTTGCPLTATGTYTLGSNASGTATLNLTGSSVSAPANANNGAVNGCFQVPPRSSLTIGAAQQGQVVVFQMAPGSNNVQAAQGPIRSLPGKGRQSQRSDPRAVRDHAFAGSAVKQ
jgi:hypothetical protein